MLSKKRTLRLVLLGLPILGLAAAALFLTFGPGTDNRAQADAPHSGLNFAIGVDVNGDGTNDCGSGAPSAVGDGAPDTVAADVSNADCPAGSTLAVGVYLMSLGTLPSYDGEASQVYYTGGVTSGGVGDAVFTGCVFEAPASQPGFENVGCAIGLPPAATSLTNLGLMSKFTFTCSAGGTLSLGHALGETGVTDSGLVEHREAGPDSVNVCGGGGGATDTPTSPPAETPTPTNTSPPAQTNTPTNTTVPTTPPANTPTRTNTPIPPTATRTPTPAVEECDVNGDGMVDAEDSLWILWAEADIVDNVPLPENADCSGDGHINSIDALWILWMIGGQV